MIQILRAQDRAPVAWKNGGGTTREIAVFPQGAGLSDFGWRVSMATVERGGPFSVFEGIDRTLAILQGRMALTIAGKDAVELTPGTAPLSFPGDVATDATLSEGPVTDLNVMTRRGAFASRVERRELAGPVDFGSADAVTIAVALATATLSHGEKQIALQAGDAILAEPGAAQTICADAPFYWIEIFQQTGNFDTKFPWR